MISLHRQKSRKTATILSEVVCLGIKPKELTLVYAHSTSGKLKIEICESYPYDNFKAELASIVKKNNLRFKPCIWVLQPKEYELVLADAMPVVNAEFQAAAKWKLKDAVHFPKDDVIFDQFPVPKSPLETSNKIMVAATRFSLIHAKSEEINESGLEMACIDIPELTYRNLTAFYEQDQKSTVLIVVKENQVQVLITCQKQIFFNRYINIELGSKQTVNAEEHQKKIDRLELEILRSSEYFQNQWRMPSPGRYFVVPTQLISSEELSYISQRLGSPVKFLTIDDMVQMDKALDMFHQRKFICLLGETLRLERTG